MTKKQIAADILPRVLWLIQGIVLFLVHKYTNFHPQLTDSILLQVVGILMIIIGLAGMFWVSRFLSKALFTRELVTGGPYQYARHPMYVAIYIILIGVGILFFSIIWFIILAAFIPIWYIDCRLEEKQMIELHQQKYLDYKKKVGMFFPCC